MMDLRFTLLTIFLICDTFVWSNSDKYTGNQDISKKNKNSIRLSEGIRNNPFLQESISQRNLSIVQGNPFLSSSYNSNRNRSGKTSTVFLPGLNRSESQSGIASNIFLQQKNSSMKIFTNHNPFLSSIGTGTKIDNQISVMTTLVTQVPYIQPFYTTVPVSQPSNTEVPVLQSSSYNMPISNIPGSVTTNKPVPTEVKPVVPTLIIDPVSSTRSRSELKCNDYMREIVGTIDITSLTGTSSSVIKVNNICPNVNQLVVGGTNAKSGDFPHMVALGRRNSDQTFILMCGGTLISHNWVLSAAHCTYGPNGGPIYARIGFLKLTDDESGITIPIDKAIRYPDYKPPALYDDIALVKLTNSVTFNTSIRPACLYPQYDSVPMQAWVSGWGSTEFGGYQNDQLLKAQLSIVNNLACAMWYNISMEVPRGITPNMICAGDAEGGWLKDSCQGDSGGPLQVIHRRNQCLFQVIGITSFGRGCANINSPGVYTRVSHYLPWIENIVWPQEE